MVCHALPMNETHTAPTKAQAEILGLAAPTYTGTPFLTYEAIIRNGGIRPNGQEHLSASKGSNRNKALRGEDMRERLIPGGTVLALWGLSGLGFVLSIWSPGAANMGAGMGICAVVFTLLWMLG